MFSGLELLILFPVIIALGWGEEGEIKRKNHMKKSYVENFIKWGESIMYNCSFVGPGGKMFWDMGNCCQSPVINSVSVLCSLGLSLHKMTPVLCCTPGTEISLLLFITKCFLYPITIIFVLFWTLLCYNIWIGSYQSGAKCTFLTKSEVLWK